MKGAAQTMYNTCHHHHPSKVVAFSHLLYFLLYITLPFCEYSLPPSLSLRFLCFLLIACSIVPVYSIYKAPNARGLSQINVSLVFLFSMSQAKQSQLWAFLTLPDFFSPCRVGLTFSHAYQHPRHKHKPQEPKDQTGTISKINYSHVRVSNCRNGVNSAGHHWHGRHGKVVCPHILQSRLEKVLKALFWTPRPHIALTHQRISNNHILTLYLYVIFPGVISTVSTSAICPTSTNNCARSLTAQGSRS